MVVRMKDKRERDYPVELTLDPSFDSLSDHEYYRMAFAARWRPTSHDAVAFWNERGYAVRYVGNTTLFPEVYCSEAQYAELDANG